MHDGSSRVTPFPVRRQLLTTRSAAAAVACDVITVRRAIHTGELQALRLGRHGDYRIPVDALEAWLQPVQPEGTRA